MAERLREVAQHAQIVDRMDVAGDELGEPAHACAVGRMTREQRRLGLRLRDIR